MEYANVKVTEPTLDSHSVVTNNTYLSQDLKLSAISYLANQPANL